MSSEPAPASAAQFPRLAYVGLGNIGLPVARNLTSYPSSGKLRVWNRSKEKYALIPEAEGVNSVDRLFEGFTEGSMVIFTSFSDDRVAKEIYQDLFTSSKEVCDGVRVVFVDQSTLSPDTSSKHVHSQVMFADFVQRG
jgi:3-hydroxyisobutyrate dehydrogenase-like beta-hydroxyacid dehydrogenase